MAEPKSRLPVAFALLLGMGLIVLAGAGEIVAVAAVVLAQPALALGLSWWRGSRAPGLRRDEALRLLALWAGGFAVAALLLAWPLQALRDGGGLGAALGLSSAAALLLLLLWWRWPHWQQPQREGGNLVAHEDVIERQAWSWQGLGVAALLALVLCAGLALAWPGLLAASLRWPFACACALLLPLLHAGVQRVAPAPAETARPSPGELPVVEMKAPAASAPAPVETPARGLAPDLAAQVELHEAARNGRVERALQLLEAGADPHAPPPAEHRDQRSLAALAAVLPDLRLLRALIARGVDLNAMQAGMTPLLAATRDSWHGRPDAVTTLLANGADPRAVDAEGNTPLHHAARSSDPGVAALLRDAAAEIDALNADGFSPLGIACIVGNWRMAKFLLERGAQPAPDNGQPVLLAAAATEEDDPAGVQLLLRHKARADARNAAGRSALHEAALAGHVGIIECLLAAGADVQAVDAQGRTPWLEAARGAQLPALEALVAAGAQAAACDGEGRSALHLACAADEVSPALVRRLLECGVDPERVDAAGRRAIDIAAGAGRWALVSALDPEYPLPAAVRATDENAPDRAPLGLLRDALRDGGGEDLAALARLCSREELGSLLHDPDLDARARAWLLGHGAPAEAVNSIGETALFALLGLGRSALPSLRVLLDAGASPAGAGGLARWLAAAGAPAAEVEALALELLERGADPFAPSRLGDPTLALAVRLDAPRLLARLLALGVDPQARDPRGMTALHLAAALGREAAMKQLIAHGAAPDVRAADGQTPLGVTLAAGRRDLADWLDWRGWALPRRPLRAADLPAAAMAGDAEAVRRLLALGLALDAVDEQGCSALLRAAGGGHREVVALLLARGADPQQAAHTGATPLSAAVSMRQAEIVGQLLQAGARLEHRLPGGVTVLMLAAALGLPDIVARLLSAGADVHASDAQGLTPLHCAALYGFVARDRSRLVALFDTLLLAGAEADSVAAGAVTPLLLLLGARAEPGTACDESVLLAALERLLDEDVSLDVQDPRGFGPLHLAALHGLLSVVQRLLRAGADPDLRDAINRSPREIAVMRGFVDVAAQFAPAVPGAPLARFLREPRA